MSGFSGNNILNGVKPVSWFGQAGVISLGLVFGLALVLATAALYLGHKRSDFGVIGTLSIDTVVTRRALSGGRREIHHIVTTHGGMSYCLGEL